MIETITWHSTVEEARMQAREQKKQLFIDLFNPGCGGCKEMRENTYSDTRVQRFINEHAVPVQLNTVIDPGSQLRYHAFWTPCSIIQDIDGGEYRRSYGSLDVDRFMAEMSLGFALRFLHSGHYGKAVELCEGALEYTRCDSSRNAENMYWMGVARYRLSGNTEDLETEWRELRKSYPESEWAKKAEFLFKRT